MRVFVILPAAGIGTRMATSHPSGQLATQVASRAVGDPGPHSASNGIAASIASTNPPKQFLTIGGEPILIHSLRAFLAVDRVDQIYVAVRAQEITRVRQQIEDAEMGKNARIFLVEGGANRQDSVSKALHALHGEADDVVLVHDAVRPLIDAATIDRTIEAVLKHGAAIVGLPAVDTIKQVERTSDGALVSSTIPRERVVHAQTPQGARYASLKRAFDEADADEFLGTDEASLLERAGIPVMVVAGSARNFKITQPGDLQLAEFYLASPAEKA